MLKIMCKNVFEGPIFKKFAQGKKVPSLPAHPLPFSLLPSNRRFFSHCPHLLQPYENTGVGVQ